jgi:hypothetical protein
MYVIRTHGGVGGGSREASPYPDYAFKNRSMRFLSIIFMCVIAAGCSAINMLYDDNNVFINERNSEVGKEINKVLESVQYYDYWKGNELYYNHKKYLIVPVDNNHSEYQFESGECKWALNVDDTTNVVASWRYIGNGAVCKYKRFYEGPF